MSHEILINVTPQETRVAMLEQGVVQELHIERASARGLVGNICLGRVARVLPGMQSAFVEIGLERAAFLHIADIWEHRQNGHGGGDTRPIEKILHEGQSLLVQVIKDPIGTKGARLSTQVSLAGRLLVYLPQDSHIGISQRIEDEAERESLRGKLQLLLPDGHSGGFIIRTMAETATEREMQSDIEYLTKLWGDLNARAPRRARAGAALPGPEPRAARAARHGDRGDVARRRRLARDVHEDAGVRARVHAGARRAHRASPRRAAAVRSAPRRGRDREGARAPRRSRSPAAISSSTRPRR